MSDHEEFLEATLCHAGMLHALAARLAPYPADAADIVQDTYLRAYAAWRRSRPRDAGAWLATICLNVGRANCAGIPAAWPPAITGRSRSRGDLRSREAADVRESCWQEVSLARRGRELAESARGYPRPDPRHSVRIASDCPGARRYASRRRKRDIRLFWLLIRAGDC